ncbi:flagellar hook-basal body complex protein FliE [Paralimibaculum aggregatum]|uniref:Flagellar hook-basal body complex protein FliE n=1 Tax=Paralimibaculum aggregatum TaxID=3036245 RepID=A0ABQ6LK46_9RHOB|nr:flagellar hook-basal body complex protein FliE [Limibaculum sp. NKW23]GMG83626.1 flagellar hook-basal body complex protein FliE [Limibaculum sp. NKW23]
MDIETSFATRLYDSARKLGADAAPPAEPGATVAETGFAETLARAAQEITETLQRGEQVADAAISGRGDVQSVVEALTATELALQTAVTVRDRVVEAYQEVLRMPV